MKRRLTDIRPALRERLAEYANERGALKQRLDEIAESEKLIHVLLNEEEMRFADIDSAAKTANGNGHVSSHGADALTAGRTPLATFLLEQLRSGAPQELVELVEAAKKTDLQFGDRSIGRSIHFALTGMAQNGLVERIKDEDGSDRGLWRIVGVHPAGD